MSKTAESRIEDLERRLERMADINAELASSINQMDPPDIEVGMVDPRPSRGYRIKQQGAHIGSAAGMGMQLAMVNEVGESLVDLAKEAFSDIPAMELALAHPDGRELAKFLMAFLVHTAAEQTDLLPNSDGVARACELQFTASTMTLMGPRLKKIRKHIQGLARVGKRLEPIEKRMRNKKRMRVEDDLTEEEVAVEEEVAAKAAAR